MAIKKTKNKKKIVKKKTSNIKKQKIIKKKKKKRINIDDISKIINKAQLSKKEISFTIDKDNSYVAENIIKDVELKYNKRDFKFCTFFTIFANEKNGVLDIDNMHIDCLEEEF